MTTLTIEQQAILSHLAWQSIADGLHRGAYLSELGTTGPMRMSGGDLWLREDGACFVTLHRNGELRGCIGTTRAYQSLGQDVIDHAFAAAFKDPRFDPLTPQEWPGLTAEISVLGPANPVPATTREQLLGNLRPGVDGLILRDGARVATFLPSVWESLPDAELFVAALQRKAGITSGSWSAATQASTYQVQKWPAPKPARA